MDNSPWLHPGFLITAAVALIGLVSWFIRLESKTNVNSIEIERQKKEDEKNLDAAKTERTKLEDALYDHIMDNAKHYNEQFMSEFKASLERRFLTMENTLKDIGGKIDRLAK